MFAEFLHTFKYAHVSYRTGARVHTANVYVCTHIYLYVLAYILFSERFEKV